MIVPLSLDKCDGLFSSQDSSTLMKKRPTHLCGASLPGRNQRKQHHLMLPALKAGATALRTAFQCSSVWPVSRLVPPRNCSMLHPNIEPLSNPLHHPSTVHKLQQRMARQVTQAWHASQALMLWQHVKLSICQPAGTGVSVSWTGVCWRKTDSRACMHAFVGGWTGVGHLAPVMQGPCRLLTDT